MAELINTIQIDIAAAPGTPLLVHVYMDHTFAVSLGAASLPMTQGEFDQLKSAAEILTALNLRRWEAEEASA